MFSKKVKFRWRFGHQCPLAIPIVENSEENILQHVHVPDSLEHKLQSMNIVQKETVDDITEVLASLQSTFDSTDIDFSSKEKRNGSKNQGGIHSQTCQH